MKRRWKILIGVAAVVIVALIVVVIFTNSIAKAGLQRGASSALGTKTTVDAVGVSLLGGSVDIKKLAIASPEGYGDSDLLDVARAYVSVSPASLLGDTVEVREVTIEAPVLRIRQQGIKSNLGVILDNINKAAPAEPGAKAAGKKYKIGSIKITGAKVDYSLMGTPSVPVVALPTITLTDISSADSTGVTLGKVFRDVLVAMVKSAGQIGGKIIPPDVTNILGATLGGAVEGVGKTVEGVTRGAEGVGGAVKDVGGMFRGLVEPKKDEQNSSTSPGRAV